MLDKLILPLLEEIKALSKEKKVLILFLITVSIIMGYYRFIFSIFFFTLITCAKKVPLVQLKIKNFLKSQKIIESHWNNDIDLVYTRRFYRFCWVSSFLIGLYSYYRFGNLSPEESYCLAFDMCPRMSLEFNILFHLFFGLIFLGLFVKFVAETHIIWCRNPVTPEKLFSFGASGIKVLFYSSIFGGCCVDVSSRTSLIEPSYIGNQWQKYFGRGFGFDNKKAFLKYEALGCVPGLDIEKMLNESRILTEENINTFVKQNEACLRKDLDLPSQYLLGIKKSIFPGIFGKK